MKGLDLLGLGSKHWLVKATANIWPDGYALGCFDTGWPHAFGDPRKAVQTILNTGKCPAVRVQIWWNPTHKGAPLDKVKRRLPAWQAMALKNPGKTIYLSPSCEYDKTTPVSLVKSWVDAIKKLAPNCVPVLTPWTGPIIPGVIIERHGTKARMGKCEFVSTDGSDLPNIDAAAWTQANANADITFGWGTRFNLFEKGDDTKPTPDKRTAAPSMRYIKGIIRLLNPMGAAPIPEFSGKIVPIKKPYLYKVYAEDMEGNKPRDNRPLLIAKGKANQATIITKLGSVVGTLKLWSKPGSYTGGLTRYYAGMPGGINKYGWEIAEKALAMSGSEFVWIRVDNVFYGPVNAAFRTGFYK